MVPIGRIVVGPWAGFAALALCLLTGNLYGHLFFTPNDVPFMAAMTWALLADCRHGAARDAIMARDLAAGACCAASPSPPALGGILAQVYLIAAMAFSRIEIVLLRGRALMSTLVKIGLRVAAALTLGWLLAIALWPFLQAANPLERFLAAYDHFGTLKLEMTIPYWGHQISTTALPWSYIPGELAARLPEVFIILLIAAPMFGLAASGRARRQQSRAGVSAPYVAFGRARARHFDRGHGGAGADRLRYRHAGSSLYDGVRHILFTLPPLARARRLVAVADARPLIRRFPLPFAALAAAQVIGAVLFVLVRLHPLEYIATNAFAGWTAGLLWPIRTRLLECRGDAGAAPTRNAYRATRRARPIDAPRLMICIPWREHMVAPMFRRAMARRAQSA